MKITLLTVSFNSAATAIRLLDSLKKQTDTDFSIVVSDNASQDVDQLREYTAKHGIHLLENKANLGFAGGNNPALAYAFHHGADWAVLINPDTWVEEDFIARLKTALSPKEGLVGIPMKEGDKTAFAGRIDWFQPTLKHVYAHPHVDDVEMLYPIGAGLAISKKAYQQLGGLDEKYFLYFEDVDYAVRARALEIPVSFIHETAIHHEVSSTTKKLGSPLLLRYHYRNAVYFNMYRGALLVKVLTVPWSVFTAIKQIIKILFNRHPEESRAILAGIVDFYQEKMGRIVTEKIKVGIECENLEDGQSRWGVGHLTLNLLEEYAKDPELQKKYELYLYFKKKIPNDNLLKNPVFNIRVIGIPSFNFFYHIFMPIRAMRDRLDWMFFPAYMLPPLYIGRSVVMLTGDVYHEYKSGKLPFRYRLAYGLFTNWAALNATKVLAISEFAKKEVIHFYNVGPERIFVSRLGVRPIPTKGPNAHGDYMLYVGQMFPRRNARETIHAFEEIAGEFPELKFILVGKDKYRPVIIKDMVKKANERLGKERVIHHEYIEEDSDIRDLYAHAKLFVYVSENESFGLPPVEAASCDVPVVVKDSDINHELFGDAAFFVKDAKDISAFADVLRESLNNEEKRGAMIRKYPEIVKNLSWERFAKTFFNHLDA